MSVSSESRRRRLPSLPQDGSRHKSEYELQQQNPARVDVERLSKLPPHILKQLRTVENDSSILTAKVLHNAVTYIATSSKASLGLKSE